MPVLVVRRQEEGAVCLIVAIMHGFLLLFLTGACPDAPGFRVFEIK
jgi:hypothetical protein